MSASFTPGRSTLGGILLGLSSTSNLFLNGRITGISGIIKGVLTREKNSEWKAAFTSGLLSSGLLLHHYSPHVFGVRPNAGCLAIVGSGILVGYGALLQSGCTSGHGICGLARKSIRSVAAVGTFMATGSLTAIAKNNIDQINQIVYDSTTTSLMLSNVPYTQSILGMTAASLLGWSIYKQQTKQTLDSLPSLLSSYGLGSIFGLGLGISGMTDPHKITQFLDFTHAWDPSLAFVMGGALVFTLFPFHFVLKRENPILVSSWTLPKNQTITPSLLLGASVFGVGWGLGGICPGPGIVALASSDISFWLWNAGFFSGIYLHKFFNK